MINLGIGRVQNITAKNVFLRERSLYAFIDSARGRTYDEVYDYCDDYYGKEHNRKYFGQIITPINLLGLIQTDENGVLAENALLADIYAARNERLANDYMNYLLCMWQYPLPSTQTSSGRNMRLFKPYCLLLKILLELYAIDPQEAYLSPYEYSWIFLDVENEDDVPELDEINEDYAGILLQERAARTTEDILQENGSLTYIINTLAESYLLTKNHEDYPEAENFYIGFKDSPQNLKLAEFVIQSYGEEFFKFDVKESAGKRDTMTKYCKYLNNRTKFEQWRSCYMSIQRIDEFKEYCENKGFHYSDDLIRRFVMSLETKPFLLLTGISGSGKTKIAELWLGYLSVKGEAEGLHIAVGSNWTDNKKLLGFKNVLLEEQDAYQSTPLVKLMEESEKQDKEYIVILDEMNLSRVEMYFADFLSALESMEHIIKLPDGKSVKWNRNLKIIGTVNVDESTYMFSPKVLDRANVIEMNGVSPREYIENVIESDEKIYKSLKDYDWFAEYIDLLDEIYADLNGEFAYRVIDEISAYVALNIKMYGSDRLFAFMDEQVSQKILPKLHGSKAQLKPKLNRLQATFADKECPLVKEKLEKMQEDVKKGYTSFIGD